ncbi:actin-like ATPase domain-containing protein [Rozella allomycis CSF55]|uniref:Actin-like ATPase domain-containing protein n=1 Tax=Rozella allomycis (strain CSF55) TaxID=988480 RepID=A0A075B0P6_ROZAC|nr:Heat shock protein 70 domain-containing protein [Rozella allomycis CSF55]RKP20241.1 actin-like ATPase domain-containing protein [Rozella allomycis CSF55]|eukprot:EPZ34544.1 Heat shock protein 70 domain-containing protein [Rozella allomycis CSF55]
MRVTGFLLLVCVTVCYSAVISIDFGSEWLKVGLVAKGRGFDMVLNQESKRKTRNILAIKEKERYFGSAGVNMMSRYPANAYPNLKGLIGKYYEEVVNDKNLDVNFEGMAVDERGMVKYNVDGLEVKVEELVAMILKNVKIMAAEYANDSISGSVIVVPGYFQQRERMAIMDAARIADLRVYSLMSDGAAVALNYAIGNRKSGNETFVNNVFYDVGSGSISASVVSFQSTNSTIIKSKLIPSISVRSVAYNKDLGGASIDRKLAEIFAREFKKESGIDVRGNKKAMAKLKIEANRVKQILSANVETFASIEGLVDEINFRMKIKRETLESECIGEKEEWMKPIKEAIVKAGMKDEEINSIILFGGGTRVPMIQKMLSEEFGDKIAKNVNSDEAAANGAVFYSASKSQLFKVKEIEIKDLNDETFIIKRNETDSGIVLFNGENGRKYLTLRDLDDATIRVENKESELFSCFISVRKGIEKILENKGDGKGDGKGEGKSEEKSKDRKSEEKEKRLDGQGGLDDKGEENRLDLEMLKEKILREAKVKILFQVESGIISLVQPFLIFNQTRIELNFTSEFKMKFQEKEEIEKSKKVLEIYENEEEEKMKLSEARNSLESFVYKINDLFEEEEKLKFASDSEISQLKSDVSNSEDLLDSSNTLAIIEKTNQISSIYSKIIERFNENDSRPLATDRLRESINNYSKWIIQNNSSLLINFHKSVNETSEWLSIQEESHSTLNLFQDSNFTSSSIDSKRSILDIEFYQAKLLLDREEEKKKREAKRREKNEKVKKESEKSEGGEKEKSEEKEKEKEKGDNDKKGEEKEKENDETPSAEHTDKVEL